MLPKAELDDPNTDRNPELIAARQGAEFENIPGKGDNLDVSDGRGDTYADFDESDFIDVSESMRNVETASESEPKGGYEIEGDLNLTNAYQIGEDGRKGRSSTISRYVDTEK